MGLPGPEPGGMDPDTVGQLPDRRCRLVIDKGMWPGLGPQRQTNSGPKAPAAEPVRNAPAEKYLGRADACFAGSDSEITRRKRR